MSVETQTDKILMNLHTQPLQIEIFDQLRSSGVNSDISALSPLKEATDEINTKSTSKRKNTQQPTKPNSFFMTDIELGSGVPDEAKLET